MRPDFKPLETVLEMCMSRGATDAEAFGEREGGLEVNAFGGSVEKFTYAESRGVGVRVWVGTRLGRAYTSDLSEQALAGAVDAALAGARVSEDDPHRSLPAIEAAPPGAGDGGYLGAGTGIYSEDIDTTPAGEKIQFALDMERLAKEHDPRVKGVESAVYSDAAGEVLLANTRGFRSAYRASLCYGYLFAIAEDESGPQTGFGVTAGRSFAALSAADAAAEAAGIAVCTLGARQVERAKVAVLLSDLSSAELLAAVSSALSGEAVVKGRSFLAGRLGERVASEAFTLVDDGGREGGFGTVPFDGEGVAVRAKAPIEGGVLKGFLHNCYTASRSGTETTGNAARANYRSQVGVSHTNLYLPGGAASREELRGGLDTGFEVLELQGVHVGLNPVTGEVSIGARGLWIEKGKPAHAVREVTIAGTLEDILGGISGVGSDLRFTPLSGSIGAPSMVIEGLVVSGK